MNKKGRILFISLTVPPITGSHGRRVTYFLKHLYEFGWKLDVLTISASPNFSHFDPPSVKNIPCLLKIFRVYPGFLVKHSTKKTNSPLIRSGYNFIKNHGGLNFIISKMKTLRSIEWCPFAVVKGAKLISRYKYDVLISSGFGGAPLIAYAIKKINKKLPWIIDYGDPWVFAPTYKDEHTKLEFLINHWLEQCILKSANVVTVTTEETKKNYLENYPFLKEEKIKVIPMGVDFDVFKSVRAERSEKFRILYAGSIYPTRGIKPFLDAIKLLSEDKDIKNNIEILFVGDIKDEYKDLVISMGLEDMIFFSNFVPYEIFLSLIVGADVLLSFGNKGGLQVPGKLFDYVGSRRPILWIKGDERDPALGYLEGLNRAIIADNDCKDIHSKILMLYNIMYKKHELEKNFDLEKMPAFSWKDRGKMLNAICMELVNANK